MICSNCNTLNGPDSVFCVNCGNAVTGGTASSMPTVAYHGANQPTSRPPADSTETAVVNFSEQQYPMPSFAPSAPYSGEIRRKNTNPLVWVAGGLILVLVLVVAGIFFIGSRINGGEILPSHLGMFVQSDNKDTLDEIRRHDFTDAIEARTVLTKDGSLPYLIAQPSLILYADGKDLPVNDIRLVQLDTLKDDGTMKTLDFQVAPIDGKNDMKRIRIPTQLATGKYAFTFFDGYFNEGKHKFWPFQVKDSSKTDNGDALKAWTVGPKPKDTAASAPSRVPSSVPPAANPPPPMTATSGGRIAYSTTSRLILRAGPSQSYAKIRNLRSGEAVEILGYSSNTEYFEGRNAPFAQVRTSSGQVGWAFSAFLR